MTGHTTKGTPYALPTDALVDWPAASLELANKIDALVWTALPFAAGWSNYDVSYTGGTYSKDALGIVRVRGLVKFTPLGSYAGPGVICTLPVGFRPAALETFPILATHPTRGACVAYQINAGADGALTYAAIDGGTWTGNYMSLAGITYAAV
jgi:hypothetical protein